MLSKKPRVENSNKRNEYVAFHSHIFVALLLVFLIISHNMRKLFQRYQSQQRNGLNLIACAWIRVRGFHQFTHILDIHNLRSANLFPNAWETMCSLSCHQVELPHAAEGLNTVQNLSMYTQNTNDLVWKQNTSTK